MADYNFIFAPSTVTVDFGIYPVLNNFNSLALLADDNLEMPGWVEDTRAKLSPERLRTHKSLFNVLHPTLQPAQAATSFEDYIALIASSDPVVLRDHVIKLLAKKSGITDLADHLGNRTAFLDKLAESMMPHYEAKGMQWDRESFVDTHTLLTDPPALQAMIVEHMGYMWEHHLAAEWRRVLPMLEESATAFQKVDFSGQNALEAVKTVTGRDLSGAWEKLDNAEHIVFIPSAHLGSYVSFHRDDEQLYLLFSARLPAGVPAQSPALTRSEMLIRLGALADETRLMILELLTEHDELYAQDIMNQLGLSQSSASRHLRQLTATGYLIERRREVAKCYSLNRERFEDTIHALRQFVKG